MESRRSAPGRRRGSGPLGSALLRLAAACVSRPRWSLGLLGLVTLTSLAALTRLELRTDGAALHPLGHPVVRLSQQDAALFGDGDELVLLVEPRDGASRLTTAQGLRSLAALHRELAALAFVDGGRVLSAASLVDAPTSTFLEPGTFLRSIPDASEALAARVERLLERPSTAGLFLAPGGEAAAIHLSLRPGVDRAPAIGRLDSWLQAREDDALRASLLGPAVAESVLGERILADLARLVPVLLLVMGLLLAACLRTPGGVLIAGCKMGIVLAWTLGLMALTGTPVTLVTTILPVLLLAMAVTDEAHVLARLQPALWPAEGGDPPAAAGEAVLSVLAELERPLVLTSVSTAIGLLSFLAVPIAPVRQFGLFAALGLGLALLLTFTSTAALAVDLPASWFRPRLARAGGDRLAALESVFLRRRGAALFLGLVVLVAALPALRGLRVQDAWVANFDPDSELVQADRRFNELFWGTYRCDVVLQGGDGAFHRPEGLALLEAARARALGAVPEGGVLGPAEALRTVAGILGLTPPLTELSPRTLAAVARLAFLQDRGAVSRVLTEEGDEARLLVVLNDADYERARALERELSEELGHLAAAAGLSAHVSGSLPLANATVEATVHGQLRSIATTFVGIAVTLLVVQRRLGRVLLQLVPASAAVLLVLAGMGLAGLPLGIATSLFAALSVGVGVDFALHLTSAFDRRSAEGRGDERALFEAAAETARGRRWSTLVLGLGFLVLGASAFAPNRSLGLLLGAAIFLSYLATLAFLPRALTR